jgi:hypothetical protein
LQANYREPRSEVGAFLSVGSSSIVDYFKESFPPYSKLFSMGFDGGRLWRNGILPHCR